MTDADTEDKVKDDGSSSIEGTKILATQVGGHRYGMNGIKMGMLDRGNGVVLKALQTPPRGTRELSLYQTTFAPTCKNKDLLELRNFLPLYYGTEVIDNVTFLVMNNITYSFDKPNILDIKMGQVTSDPEATAKKRKDEELKYPPSKELGFRITGMMIHDISSGQPKHFTKDFCYRVTAENMLTEGLGKFFGLHNGKLRKDVLNELLWKLHHIEDWFMVQRTYAFYSSSLLIVYGCPDQGQVSSTSSLNSSQTHKHDDTTAGTSVEKSPENGTVCNSIDSPHSQNNNVQTETTPTESSPDSCGKGRASQKRGRSPDSVEGHSEAKSSPVHKQSKTSQLDNINANVGKNVGGLRTCENASDPSIVEVRMIDFAHVFPATGKDDNYLFGLRKLIGFVEQLLKM